jgi:hypothetical protein
MYRSDQLGQVAVAADYWRRLLAMSINVVALTDM